MVACTNGTADSTPLASVATQAATPTLTVTPVPTAVPSQTPIPTPSNTATPAPTPTATAVPLTVSGDLRSLQLSEPAPSGNAPCGLVDLLDFPINPPDAANVGRGGGDFGVFRSRFDKFHAGEDWGGLSGQSNLGTPVYSVGHGFVTYAQPLGWGRDQGVLIVQHTFADGRIIFSFYGHLDPDSVVLAPGTCVARGEKVGEIGQPRGSAHLHFEIRTQAPYQTLTGYWPEDPTTQGWLWPSQQIWAARVGAIPGVSWVRPFANPNVQPIGQINDDSFLILEAGQLLRVHLADGRADPLDFGLEKVDVAQVSENGDQLFIAESSSDTLAAYHLPDLTQQWQRSLPLNGAVSLLPLPDGAVLAATRTEITAVSATGDSAWTIPLESRILDWHLTDDALYLTTDGNNGRMWQINLEQATPVAELSGKLAATENALWLYAREGLYRLDLTRGPATPDLVYQLPVATVSRGDLLPLPDGRLLLAHADVADRRLIQFEADGAVQWQRSYAGQFEGNVTLHMIDDQPYLAASIGSGVNGTLTVFALDMNQNSLTRLFEGGSRTPVASDMWITAVSNNQLLINVGGGPLALFNPIMAAETDASRFSDQLVGNE